MRLRNKKTGEVVDFLTLDLVDSDEMEFVYVQASGHENAWSYRSLEKFNEEWEDYVPKEPLIKDEKIRKAVRAWAEACNIERAYLRLDTEDGSTFCVYNFSIDCHFMQIATHDHNPIEGGRVYSIAELCGEEGE